MFLAPTLAGVGFISGGAFSLYLGIAGRDRRLFELNPGRIALGTGVTVGLLMEAFLIAFVTLRGFPVSVGPSIITASIFGGLAGVTALGQVKIAQKALTPGEEGPDELESGLEQLLPDPEGEGV
jgi:tellurite resistance protein TehA-like permease